MKEKTDKYRKWDLIFGFGYETFRFKTWKSKNGSAKFFRDCPCEQISDPDLPF